MEDFFDRLKENLENRPDPPFEKRLWERLEMNLDQPEVRSRPSSTAWWLMVGFCLLLLTLNLMSMKELRQLNQQVETLEHSKDTVYLTEVVTRTVHQIDTVYQTRTIHQHVTQYRPTPFSNPAFTTHPPHFWMGSFSENSPPSNLHTADIGNDRYTTFLADNPLPGQRPLLQYLHDNNSTDRFTSSSNNKIVNFAAVENLATLDHRGFEYRSPHLRGMTLLQAQSKTRKTVRQHLYTMRPKGFQLGLHGGWVNIGNKDIQTRSRWSTGMHAAIVFSPSLQLWTDLSYIDTEIKSEAFSKTTPEPSERPPSDDYEFFKAEADVSLLAFSTGLQYFLNPNGKWKPFLGLGFAAQRLHAYNWVYEYEHHTQSLEWTTDLPHPSQSYSDFLLFRAGLEYQFSDHWNWQMRFDYSRRVGGDHRLIPSLLSMASGLNYRF